MNIPYLDLKAVTALHRDEIQAAVADVVGSGRYLQGEKTAEFERNFATYTGYNHCIGTANGLDALTLTLRAYRQMGMLRDGDEVIAPANTFIATVLAITDNNLTPVFVEPHIDTLEIDDRLVERAISPKTKAMMLVHLYGRNAWTDRLTDICNSHKIIVIEDCAQAHGCKGIGARNAGLATENVSCYSFYPGKNLGALGDGGAVVTDNESLAAVVRSIANYGFSRKYVADYEGRNSRLDEVQAAVLDVKLRHLDADNARRIALARVYYNGIAHPLVHLPVPMPCGDNVYHIFPVLCRQRDLLQQHLANHGVGTLIHYPIPPHRQQCYRRYAHLDLPVTERIAQEELSLPLNQTMTDDEAAYVVDVINSMQC